MITDNKTWVYGLGIKTNQALVVTVEVAIIPKPKAMKTSEKQSENDAFFTAKFCITNMHQKLLITLGLAKVLHT